MSNDKKVKNAPSTAFLRSEKITVKYIIKPNPSIKDPKHVGYGGLFENTEISIPAPTMDNNKMKNLLTNEEKEGLEYILNGMSHDKDISLSVYGPFWKESAKNQGLLPIFLSKSDTILDLSDPFDYIKYKVLKASPIVADGLENIRSKATNRFVLVAEGAQAKKDQEAVGSTVVAYEKYVEYKNNKSVLRYILRGLGKYTSKKQDLSFLQIEAAKLIQKDPSMFVAMAADKLIKGKVLIEECVENNIIIKKDKKYYTQDNDPISDGDSPTFDVAAGYLVSALGQDMRLSLEARLKNSKE